MELGIYLADLKLCKTRCVATVLNEFCYLKLFRVLTALQSIFCIQIDIALG